MAGLALPRSSQGMGMPQIQAPIWGPPKAIAGSSGERRVPEPLALACPYLPQRFQDKNLDPGRSSWAGQVCKQSKETLWFNAGSAAAFPSPPLASPAAPQCYQHPFPSSTGFRPHWLYPC